jgi:TonB family protein
LVAMGHSRAPQAVRACVSIFRKDQSTLMKDRLTGHFRYELVDRFSSEAETSGPGTMPQIDRIRVVALSLVPLALCSLSGGSAKAQDGRKAAPAATVIRKPLGALEKEATERVEPVYPPLARAAKVTGTVLVEVTVDETGNVTKASAVSGHALLKDAAVEAARKWKFRPPRISGAPVRVTGLVVFKFAIDGAKEAESDQPSPYGSNSKPEEIVREDQRLCKPATI